MYTITRNDEILVSAILNMHLAVLTAAVLADEYRGTKFAVITGDENNVIVEYKYDEVIEHDTQG